MTSTGQLGNELAEPAESYDEEGRRFDQDGWHFDIDRYAWKRDGECWAPIGDTYKFIGWGVIPRGPNATGPDTRQEPTLESTVQAARANRELWDINPNIKPSRSRVQGKWLEYHAKLLGWPANEFYRRRKDGRLRKNGGTNGPTIGIGRNITAFRSGGHTTGPTRRFLEAHRNWKDGDEFPYFTDTCVRDYMKNRTDGLADPHASGRLKTQLRDFVENYFPGYADYFEFANPSRSRVQLTADAKAWGHAMAEKPSARIATRDAAVASGDALGPGMDDASQSMWGSETVARVISDQQFYGPSVIDAPGQYTHQIHTFGRDYYPSTQDHISEQDPYGEFRNPFSNVAHDGSYARSGRSGREEMTEETTSTRSARRGRGSPRR